MNNHSIILILLVILCIQLILCINNYTYTNEPFELSNINNIDFGNALSVYYFNIVLATLKQSDFNIDNSDKAFLQYLPKNLKYNILEKYYLELDEAGITIELFTKLYDTELSKYGYDFWSMTDKTKEKIHFIMKPLIHKLFDDALSKSNINKLINGPVIHFRCADDAPFIKHKNYHFQKYSFFKDALNDINQQSNNDFDSVILLSCSYNTNKQNQESCSKYTDHLSNYLKSIDYEVDIKCGTELDDFATMFYAPAVISTSSSFSFMAGFFGKGIFINTMSSEDQDKQCLDCGDWLYKGYNILHAQVDNYNNVEHVHSLLISPHT